MLLYIKNKYTYIDSVDVIEKKMRFHVFFIHEWEGEHPSIMNNDGDEAKLVWMDVEKVVDIIQTTAGTFAIKKVLEHLSL